MKAIKVLYRLDSGDLESAIPTAFSLGYEEGETTFPEYGKLMVYLDNEAGMKSAQRLGHDAKTWCRDSGQVEIWRVDCHNLYKMPAIIYACDLGAFQKPTVGMLEGFWALIALGNLGAVEKAFERDGGESLVNVTKEEIWSTDWLIPRERLGILPAGVWEWDIEEVGEP